MSSSAFRRSSDETLDQGPDAGWLVNVLVAPAGHASRRKAGR